MKRKFPESVYNPITFVGAAIALISFGLIIFLMLLETLSTQQKPYMGIIAFVILPGFLIIGLILIAFGIIRHRRRLKSGKDTTFKFPVLNLNDPRNRTAFTVFFLGTILLLLFSAFGSYKAYEYTDSDEFCGTLCHKVMTPEYTAYQVSPHAKVGCVKCHIGPGAGWYVRSKLSGAYQVYSTIFNKYPRPIPTPISNLRPARETCEQCHWPEFFYSEKEIKNIYYLSDEQNTKSTVTMLLKIGGGNEETGITSGIHWHMNIANKITYIAADSSRQTIPWVKAESRDGKVTVYKSNDFPFKNDTVPNGSVRVMDCIDCHNRPTHIYHPPYSSVDHMMSTGLIDTTLPYIKSVSVDALENSYSTKETALDSIKIYMENFYNTRYPKIASSKSNLIEKSVKTVQKIYQTNYFPAMGVNWKKFPNNIGHMYYPGCFRCHDGNHVSADGKVIPKDCNTCHTIIEEKNQSGLNEESMDGLTFVHPVDLGTPVDELVCTDCHSAQ
jgi:NapC/NirT cytochrome c family, N-terminal region